MDEKEKMEGHLQSAAAFVEGGIQDVCDDCSICLEDFCDSNPLAVTSCKHEFHLQCILEWCQRSSQCPKCLRPINLKDPNSQELLEAVERERSFKVNQNHNTTIFHHPTLGELELQHLPVGATDADLEESIIQHLAAAAAMRRAHHGARRLRGGSASQSRPQFLVFSTHPSATTIASVSGSSANEGEHDSVSTTAASGQSVRTSPSTEEQIQQQASFTLTGEADRVAASQSRSSAVSAYTAGLGNLYSIRENRSVRESSPIIQDRAGASDFHAFSDSLKSRLNAVSMRYKESISKSSRGWKERLFSRCASMADIGSEMRREVNAGIATVSRMMELIDVRENSSNACPSSRGVSGHSAIESNDTRVSDGHSNVVSRK